MRAPGFGRPSDLGLTSPGWLEGDFQSRCIRVRYAGLEFNAVRRDTLTVRDLPGWWEGAPDETETIRHPGGDGDIQTLRRLGARTIELVGSIHAGRGGSAIEQLGRIQRARSGTLVVSERGGDFSREADVRQTGLPYKQHTPTFIQFSLFLRADDPLRYGSGVMDLKAATVLPNRGDVTAAPVLDVTGPHGALTVVHAAGTWTLAALASGQSRTVDLRNGDVWNGQARVFGSTSGPAAVVPSGGASWTVTGLGAGAARVRRYEAWS